MAAYQFDVASNLATSDGVCLRKVAREIKAALALAKKPKADIIGLGQKVSGTDNWINGTVEFRFPGQVLDASQQATLLATLRASLACAGSEDGWDKDDLDDLAPTARPGQTFYVQDLLQLDGVTKGCLVYRHKNGTPWRRVSNDAVV